MANPFDSYRLDDEVAVVTGAASGIGASTCEVLAAAGATVVCGDVNTDGLDTTVKLVDQVGGRALAVTTDVTVRADVERLVGAAVSEFGRIDAMCNIAGAMFPGLIEDLDDETIDRGIDLNLKGVLYGTQYAVRAMKPFGRGSIVNVSSAAIDEPYAGIGVYAFTKAAVAMLTMTTALEVGEHGIRVERDRAGCHAHTVHDVAPPQARRHARPGGIRRVRRAVEGAVTAPRARRTDRPGPPHPLPRVRRGTFRDRQHLPRQRRPDDGLVATTYAATTCSPRAEPPRRGRTSASSRRSAA